MFYEIAAKVLPPAIALIIGCFSRRIDLFGEARSGNFRFISDLKRLITNIFLPLVLFNAFFTASYSWHTAIYLFAIYGLCTLSLFLFSKPIFRFAARNKYLPFMMTAYEGGMLGYSLYAILMGKDSLSHFAVADIGNTLFVFTLFIMALGKADSKQMTLREQFVNCLRTPTVVAMFAGIIAGATGIGSCLAKQDFFPVYRELVAFVSGPTSFLILFAIGYDLQIERRTLGTVSKILSLRLLWQLMLAAVLTVFLYLTIRINREQRYALYVLCALPAPFIIPMFSDTAEDGKLLSSFYSCATLLTVLLFIALIFAYEAACL